MNQDSQQPVVLHVVHSLDGGGMERNLRTLVTRLTTGGPVPSLPGCDASQPVHIVCTFRPTHAATDSPNALHLESLNQPGTSRLAFLKLARLIGRIQPRIIHARNANTWIDAFLAWQLAGSTRTALLLGFHGLEQPTISAKRKAVFRLLGLNRMEFTTVANHGCSLLQRELGVPPEQVHTVCNGVDTDHYAPPSPTQRSRARTTFGLDPGDLCIAIVASLVPVKAHDVALTALQTAFKAQHIPRHRVLIAGTGPHRERLERFAREKCPKLNVRFLGSLSDVLPLLWASDFILSTSRFEQSSNALLEAMACGLPVVTTNVGGTGELITDGREGWLCRADDVPTIAERIDALTDSASMRRQMGRLARIRACSCFGIEKMISGYARLYATTLEKQPNRRLTPCAASPA